MIKKTVALSCLLLAACQGPLIADNAMTGADASTPTVLNVAQFTPDGELVRPDVTAWIHMGSSIGPGYAPGEFDSDRPGTIQVVQMEPFAYDYFVTHGEYANGTMYSLSFYNVQEQPRPRLNGFAQQDLAGFEIHVLDKTRYIDHRGFYLFEDNAGFAPMVPPGNECVRCHNEEGAYDGTFIQFYPPVRHVPGG